MNSAWQALLTSDFGAGPHGLDGLLLTILMAFCLGHVIAWVYMWTHSGLSYSRTFVVSLLLVPMLVALVITLMSGDIVVAFGMLSVLAIIRFRNVLKDTRDTVVVMWAILEGVAVGTQRFGVAVVACVAVAAVLVYAGAVAFGTRGQGDVLLSLRWTGGGEPPTDLQPILLRHARRVQIAARADSGVTATTLALRLRLRDPARLGELLGDVRTLTGIEDVTACRLEDETEP